MGKSRSLIRELNSALQFTKLLHHHNAYQACFCFRLAQAAFMISLWRALDSGDFWLWELVFPIIDCLCFSLDSGV